MERRLALLLGAVILGACSQSAEVIQEAQPTHRPAQNPNSATVCVENDLLGPIKFGVSSSPNVDIQVSPRLDATPVICPTPQQ